MFQSFFKSYSFILEGSDITILGQSCCLSKKNLLEILLIIWVIPVNIVAQFLEVASNLFS